MLPGSNKAGYAAVDACAICCACRKVLELFFEGVMVQTVPRGLTSTEMV
jgi:hypothetical protein